jgi:hypothetical protein
LGWLLVVRWSGFDLLDGFRAQGGEEFLQLIELGVGEIGERRFNLLGLFGEQADDAREIRFRALLADTRDNFATVQFKIRAQHFDGKFTELRSRTARPARAAGMAGPKARLVGAVWH